MKPLLAQIVGDPGRTTLESRIYNALTFFTLLAAVFVLPLVFIIELSKYHIASVLLICTLGCYLYYQSRFKKVKRELFLIVTGLGLLTVIWVTGYGSNGYVFLFYQFLMLYSLLVLEKKSRVFFFLLIPVMVLSLTAVELSGLFVPKQYTSDVKRNADFIINVAAWFVFTGLIIKIIIDNFRIERQRLDYELAVAQKLQMRLLPRALPEIPGYSMHALYHPMEKVGGDFYDCSVLDGRIDILIADVSGHGLPGAFLSSITKMAFQYERPGRTPSGVLSRVNAAVLGATVDSNFITAFYCSIDRATNVMRCASAGHFPALIRRGGGGAVEAVKPRGKPLGLFDDPGIEEMEIKLYPGDRLILYTDGITECCNDRGEMFGIGAFTGFIAASAGSRPDEFAGKLMDKLRDHSGADFFEDDITLVVFDVLGAG